MALRTRLCLIVAIMLTPALLLLATMSQRTIRAERAQIEESLRRILNQLSVEIDREMAANSALLNVLATSHTLEIDDLERFYQRASSISRQLDVHIILRRPHFNNRLISTALPWPNTPELISLTGAALDAEQQALESGKLVVSDVFRSLITDQLVVAAILPVPRNGPSEYLLGIAIPVAKFARILENAPPGPGRLAAVMDRSNNIVARSEKSELYAGSKGHSLPNFAINPEGAFDSASREGTLLHSVYKRIPSTGWTVVVGEQTAQIDAAARRTMMSTAAAGTTLFAFAIGLSYVFGGRLEQRVGTLGIDRNPTREEFALLFDSDPNGVALVDDHGLVLLANTRLEQIFGFAAKELIGKPIETLIPDKLREAHASFRETFADGPVPRIIGPGLELQGRHRDGCEFPIEVRLQPIRIQASRYTMATVTDISFRVFAARQLAKALAERDRLRRDLMRSSDNERLRLSHELHDQTGQTLAAAALVAKDIERFLASDGRERLSELNALLEQMGKTLHQVAWELRPTSIDELGLRATLENHVSDWSDQTGIGVDFYCEDENLDRLPDDVRTTIYRLVQEALTNIVKHATEADAVSVVIHPSSAMLQITIEDNGAGFDLVGKQERLSKHRSLGIAGMRERLSLIGGTLEIESSVGGGTTVFARIPIEPLGATS